eukprot:jgi/Psemu1/246862/estExt_Genewise1.C_8880001
MIQKFGIGIAKGLEYLHENGVILRDLKPDNVGFDADDNPVIFDLGFARELHTVHQSEVAGSLRYMSPEMGLSQGITFASDVYSFGVMLYELCTFEKPFKNYKGRPEFVQDVFLNNYRPDLADVSSKAIKDLISNCWDTDQSKRPSMKRVGNILRIETALLDRQQQRSDDSVASGNSSASHSVLKSAVDVTNTFARRSSIIRRMSNESFDWNSSSPPDQEDDCYQQNKTLRRTQRRRNSLTSSLLDRRRRRNNSSMSSLTSFDGMQQSGSVSSLALNNIKESSPSYHSRETIKESSPSDHTRETESNHCAKRRASNESEISLVSLSGDSQHTSWSGDMSTSNFTLGEFRARPMGVSRRNSFFSSFSKDLFTINVRRGPNLAENSNIEDNVFADDCIEDLSSVPEKEGVHLRETERVKV